MHAIIPLADEHARQSSHHYTQSQESNKNLLCSNSQFRRSLKQNPMPVNALDAYR